MSFVSVCLVVRKSLSLRCCCFLPFTSTCIRSATVCHCGEHTDTTKDFKRVGNETITTKITNKLEKESVGY